VGGEGGTLRERMRQKASGLKEAAVTSGWDFGVVGKLSEPRVAETAEELFERAKLLHRAQKYKQAAELLELANPNPNPNPNPNKYPACTFAPCAAATPTPTPTPNPNPNPNKQAVELIEEAHALQPKVSTALSAANLRLKLGQWDRAAAAYRQVRFGFGGLVRASP
jgi:hypothetical protein